MTGWRALLHLPAFESELDRLRARLILVGLITLLSGIAAGLGWSLFAATSVRELVVVLGVSGVLHAACVLMLKHGRLRVSGLLLVLNAMASTFLLLVIANGFYDAAMLVIPLVFLSASFLLQKRDYLLVVGAMLAGLCGVLALHLGGWYDTPIGHAHRPDVVYDFGIIVLISALTAMVPYVFTTQLRQLLERVQRGERELRELNASLDARVAERTALLERSNRELETANRELRTFEKSLSHSLRTPLRHVGGYADILLEDIADSLKPEERDLLRRMKSAAVDLGQMGDALLAYSRLNDRSLDPQPLDLARTWQSVVEDAVPSLGERRIEWLCTPVPSCTADPVLMRQALRLLLDNSLKFSSRKPHARIEFGFDATAQAYYVRDDGAGLDMAYSDKLFKVFERLHSREEFPGLGMGLAMVSRIIGRHGGQVRVESRMGEGATFYFTLPVAGGGSERLQPSA